METPAAAAPSSIDDLTQCDFSGLDEPAAGLGKQVVTGVGTSPLALAPVVLLESSDEDEPHHLVETLFNNQPVASSSNSATVGADTQTGAPTVLNSGNTGTGTTVDIFQGVAVSARGAPSSSSEPVPKKRRYPPGHLWKLGPIALTTAGRQRGIKLPPGYQHRNERRR